MSGSAKRLLWFFVIFLAGSSVGFLIGGYSGSNFGMSLVINSALSKDALDMNTQLQALRLIREGDSDGAAELLESSVDDTLVIFDPAKPYPGVKEPTRQAIDEAIRNAFQYRQDYPRQSDRPQVDTMVGNLFEKHDLTPQ